jgi:hypothetical protein
MSETEDNEEWVPAAPVLEESVEPLRPLIQEARWTSSLVAEQLLADSEAFYAEWSPLHAHPPYAVYHYTDTSGLKGILESGHLRAMDVVYLDHSREIGYTYSLFREHLRKRWRSNDQLVGDFCLQAELALDPKRWSRNLFIACFAENGDALTQWRTHGTDGAYAIGLRTGVLESVGVRLQRSELRRVIYSAEHQNALLQHTLDRAINVVRAAHVLPEQERAGVIAVVVEFLSDHFIELVAAFKRPHLQEELEWRLAIALDPTYAGERTWQVQFAARDGHPVPFVDLDISPRGGPTASPVAEVVCGPIDRSELAARSIQLLLKSRGNASARVRHSALNQMG